MDSKKPSLAILALGKMKSKGGDADPDADGLQMAMQDLLDAIKSEDAAGMAEAFQSAADMCRD